VAQGEAVQEELGYLWGKSYRLGCQPLWRWCQL